MKKLHMGPAQCALDLGDGSERAEYVNQDYILHKLGRPGDVVLFENDLPDNYNE